MQLGRKTTAFIRLISFSMNYLTFVHTVHCMKDHSILLCWQKGHRTQSGDQPVLDWLWKNGLIKHKLCLRQYCGSNLNGVIRSLKLPTGNIDSQKHLINKSTKDELISCSKYPVQASPATVSSHWTVAIQSYRQRLQKVLPDICYFISTHTRAPHSAVKMTNTLTSCSTNADANPQLDHNWIE